MCLQDCEFCRSTIEADTAGDVRELGKEHLENNHYEEFSEVFATEFAGESCRDQCGYTFSASVGVVAGFECPGCGHNHFESFASQYLFWQLEFE